jgi:integrase
MATRYYEEVGKKAATADNIDMNLAWICENINVAGSGRETLLADITEPMLLELAARRRGAGSMRGKDFSPLAEGTVNRSTLNIVRRLLRRAAVTWKVNTSVIDWAAVRTPESKQGLFQREMTLENEREFFAALRPDIRDVLEYLISTGARRRGALDLEWGHIDFDAGVFRVRRKTSKPGEHWQEIPMTARIRALFLRQRCKHPRFVFTYEVYRSKSTKTEAREGSRSHAPRLAFSIRTGKYRKLTATVLRRHVKKALIAIGMPKFRVHDFRHTLARRQLRTVKDIRTVQRTLGHSDIATTAIYADVLTEDVRNALEATEAAYNPQKSPRLDSRSAEGDRKKFP